jgi:hypothetical protein
MYGRDWSHRDRFEHPDRLGVVEAELQPTAGIRLSTWNAGPSALGATQTKLAAMFGSPSPTRNSSQARSGISACTSSTGLEANCVWNAAGARVIEFLLAHIAAPGADANRLRLVDAMLGRPTSTSHSTSRCARPASET